MKITNVRIEKLQLELYKPFKIALGVIEHVDTMLVKIETDEGIYGIGEGAPMEFVTGDSLDHIILATQMLGKVIIGHDPLNIEKLHSIMDNTIARNTGAKAAIDIALYDIKGKVMRTPLYKVLGGNSNKFDTDITIGISAPSEMAKEAKERVDQGFKILKIKAGLNPEEDVEAVRLIRGSVGQNIRLRMDANQGWSVSQAVNVMKAVKEYGVEAVEQPVPYWDIEGMALIREKVDLMVMADESVFSPIDAIRVVRSNAADVINIKLMKSGGLYRGEQINAISEAAHINCMVGCMLESKVAVTAGASLVAAKKNITEADMDSFLYTKDSGIKGGLMIEQGIIILPETPGLGIDIDF